MIFLENRTTVIKICRIGVFKKVAQFAAKVRFLDMMPTDLKNKLMHCFLSLEDRIFFKIGPYIRRA